MGFMSPNYEKPGPGVDKDAPKKKGFFLFFELLCRKYFRLMKSGMLLFLFSLPTMFIMSLAVFWFVSNITTSYFWLARLVPMLAVVLTLVLGGGPASAGFAYIARCYVREEHSWIASDFFERLKSNFKQALVVAIVDIFVVIIGGTALYSYLVAAQNSGSIIWFVLANLTALALLAYLFLHIFIYQIMITYECKMRELYKNSLIFALGKAPMNLFLVIVVALLTIFIFDFTSPGLGLVLMFILFMGPLRFPMEFYAARTLNRMIPKEEK